MPDQKISQLSSGTNAQAGDLFVIARGASNFNLTTAQLLNAPSAAATFASLTVSGDLTVDTNTLFVDSANNRVGVLTTTPGSSLDVNGSIRTQIAGGGTGRFLEIGTDGSGTTRFFNNYSAGGDFGFAWRIGALDRMLLNANGGLQTINTIGVGNTTPATSGAGVSFPATQSASSDVNTLDDYEEGTWVPTLTNLTLGNAVTAFRYVKVGQMVTLDISIEWGSTTSASGQWRISLPFNAQATGGGSAYLYDDTGSEYVVPATVYTASFGQTVVIGSGSGAGFVTNTAPFTWAQNDRFGCSITYRATT